MSTEDVVFLLLAVLCIFAYVAPATYRYGRNRILYSPEDEAGAYALAAAVNLGFIMVAMDLGKPTFATLGIALLVIMSIYALIKDRRQAEDV